MRVVGTVITVLLTIMIIASCGEKVVEVPGAPFLTSYEEAKTQAAANGRDILIDFYTDT